MTAAVEEFLTVSQVAASTPLPVIESTVLRWISRGLLRSGVRVKLQARRFAGRWLVRREDLEKFLAAVGGASTAT